MYPLLEPDAERIMPAEHKPARDHAPEELALGSPLWLRDDLSELIWEEQVYSRVIDLVKFGADILKAKRKVCSGEGHGRRAVCGARVIGKVPRGEVCLQRSQIVRRNFASGWSATKRGSGMAPSWIMFTAA